MLTLALVLNQHGFQAIACYSVDDALTILKTFRPDFLISDVVLDSESSGIDIAIASKQLAPRCKVVLISGNAATTDLLEKATQSGHSFTCLAKPLHPKELLEQMGRTPRTQGPMFPPPNGEKFLPD